MLSNSVVCADPVAVASDLAITFSMYFFQFLSMNLPSTTLKSLFYKVIYINMELVCYINVAIIEILL